VRFWENLGAAVTAPALCLLGTERMVGDPALRT
jgi:hypothetical protein